MSELYYSFDKEKKLLVLTLVSGKQHMLDPAYVRRNDTSAVSINEWTGEKMAAGGSVSDDIVPVGIQAVGNYAVLIMWEDNFNQVQVHSCVIAFAFLECDTNAVWLVRIYNLTVGKPQGIAV